MDYKAGHDITAKISHEKLVLKYSLLN